MTTSRSEARTRFDQLEPGDQIEVDHTVTVGIKSWIATTAGSVVSTERRRHGLHFRRADDDQVYSDLIVLRRPDGELTTVAVDEFTVIRPT
jgi:hypothetical protein